MHESISEITLIHNVNSTKSIILSGPLFSPFQFTVAEKMIPRIYRKTTIKAKIFWLVLFTPYCCSMTKRDKNGKEALGNIE